MLLSRFWYVILSFALAAAVGVLFVAQSFHNRNTQRWMNEALAADSSAVGWYLKDDARNRAVALLPVALAPELREGLAKASEADEVSNELRAKVRGALRKSLDEVPAELKFTAVWAIDADGRVIGDYGWEHKADWNIGGFAVVADALAGWIRDDAWVLKEKLYRVVARPVERDGGGEPVGAVVALVAVDDAFADAVWKRTRAAGGTGEPGGLTDEGRALVKEFDRLGIIHDTSHLAEQAFWDLLNLTPKPVIASHSNCRAIVPTDRQLSDEMIKAIAARGGVIGINFYDKFLIPPAAAGKRRATLGDVVAHIRHICDLTGSHDHVAIGTDMDGGLGREQIPQEITSSADLPQLAAALTTAGFDAAAVRKIMGENWMRFFQQNLA